MDELISTLVSTLAENWYFYAYIPFSILFVLAVHEGGHYLAARLLGMQADQVTIGAGRRLWQRRGRGGTLWDVRLWPVSAHVHINFWPRGKEAPLWRRMSVVLAGAGANFILPFFLFFIFFSMAGKPYVPAVVTGVETGKPAYEAGIRPGDIILAINGTPVTSTAAIRAFTENKTSEPLQVRFGAAPAHGNETDTVKTVSVVPHWAEYRDIKGVLRAHGRIGTMHAQTGHKLEHVRAVNGQEVADEDQARTLVLDHLGQNVTIALKSTDGQVKDFLVSLPPAANQHLTQSGHKDYEAFWTGALEDNRFMAVLPPEAATEALRETGRIFKNLAALPFNLFPVDRQNLKPETSFSGRGEPVRGALYRMVFVTALLSVFIGLINLLPLPGLDGGVALLSLSEKLAGRALGAREKALLISGALIILYGLVFLSNARFMHGYFAFLIDGFN